MATDDRQELLERELFLRALLAAPAGSSLVKSLTGSMHRVEVPKDGVLYHQGSDDGAIHFIVRGAVELRADGAAPLELAAPAIVGLFDVLLRRPYTRTAHAKTDLVALWLRQEDWFDALEDNFDAARTAIRRSGENIWRMHLEVGESGGFPPPAKPTEPPKRGLNLLERTLALRTVVCFRGATVQALAELAQTAEERFLEPGETLLREGDLVRSIFVVTSGVVRVERADGKLAATFGPGCVVGGASAVQAERAPFTAIGDAPAVLLEIEHPALYDAIEDHVEMIRSILAGTAYERDEIERIKGNRVPGTVMIDGRARGA